MKIVEGKNLLKFCLLIFCLFFNGELLFSYDRVKTVNYANKWAHSRNIQPDGPYTDYDRDCANFVSQCLIAGGIRFDSSQGYMGIGDTIIRAADMPGALATYHGAVKTTVNYDYLNSERTGQEIIDFVKNTAPSNLQPGDIISLSVPNKSYFHTLIIVGKTEDGDLLCNAHNDDNSRKKLSLYIGGMVDGSIKYNDVNENENFDDGEYPIYPTYIHMPDSPIVKQAQVMQDYRIKYNAFHNYSTNSLESNVSEVIKSGEIKTQIIFDTSMGVGSFSNPVVTFGAGHQFEYEGGNKGWPQMYYPNDTWNGKYTIPAGQGTEYDGINTIKIVAVAEDGSQLDADEDLTVYNPGADTLHKITIDASEPEIAIKDSLNKPILSGTGGTQDTYLCISASDAGTGLSKLEIYKDGNIWFAGTGYCGYLKEAGLYTIKACDKSGNCAIREIRIGPEEPPPGPFEQFADVLKDFLRFPHESENLLPHDPNAMYGPEGQVMPGQTMSYTIEFENEGDGTAYGVYITDMFDKNLDDSNLIVKDFYLVDWETEIETPAELPYNYDPNSRVLTVLAGDFGPKKGGKFTVELKLKNETPIGAITQNKAIVYFPTVFEETHTNTIVSIVPSQTSVSYTGDIAAQFSDFAKFQANVSADNKVLSGKKIKFEIAQTTYTVLSNMASIAEIHKLIDLSPGSYEMKTEFPGDDFYYLPSSRTVSFDVQKEKVVLSAPFASVSSPEDVSLIITMTDDDNSEILLQNENPKTIYLDILENDIWTPISQSLLSETTAGFKFPFPQPLKLSRDIRARFEGDSFYEGAITTGTLSLIDNEAPNIAINSPQGGEIFAGATPFQISFDITDNADPAPTANAYLNHLTDGIRIEVSNGDSFAPVNLSPGTWALTVEAIDWAQNSSFMTTSSFEIVTDALPPRTEIIIGEPKYGAEPIYISSRTLIGFNAQDDMFEIGDNQGLGVDKTLYSIDSGDYINYSADFNIMEEGPHHLNYYSADVAENIETVNTSDIAVDNTAPVTNVFIGEPKYNLSDGNILISSSTLISLTATDPLSHNVASGIKESFYRIEDIQAVYSSSFSVAGSDGAKNIYYYSFDNVLNLEIMKSTSVIIDNTPPISLINSPMPQLKGIDKIFNKKLFINISVSDEYLKNYKLEIAEGENAESEFSLLYESTVTANNSEIYILNTKNYSNGYYSIKLEAEDFAGNRTNTISNIYIGKPQIELIIEGLNKPKGVATDKLGNIYISEARKNRVLKLNQTGEILAKFSGIDRNTKEKGLKNPAGIAVDDNFDIYIADRDNHRIAIMNQYGSIIKTIGKTNPKGKPIPGKKEKELHSPTGVAVSIDRIIVADKDSIKIFDKNADFIFEIADDSKRDYFDIAIDTQGNIYATDTKNNKALMYDTNGNLLKTIDDLKEPKGIDTAEYLYIADEKNKNILKYNLKGEILLEFGLKRPYALALDKESNLYTTDREKGKLHKFVLNPQAFALKIKLKENEKFKETEEERIKNRNGKIFVNAEIGEIVQIKVYDSQGRETDFKEFSAPKNVKGVFKYTYSLKEALLNNCEIKLISDSDLIEYKKFENCGVIIVELK